MQYRRLGHAGVQVSTIALGSWLTYGGSVAEEAAAQCIRKAYDLGITFFDTANVYNHGAAEQIVGRTLKEYPRDSYVLATKVYFPVGEGPNHSGLSRKHIMEQCHASLRRLGADYIDLYQCHRYDDQTPLEETLRALDDLVTLLSPPSHPFPTQRDGMEDCCAQPGNYVCCALLYSAYHVSS